MVRVGDEMEPCPGCQQCAANDGLVFRMSAGRTTKSHEYVFLLSRSPSYFYDADAVREDGAGRLDLGDMNERGRLNAGGPWANKQRELAGRNRRSVWEIATQPYAEAHFATYPTALVEPCIKAGTSERGCCPECGAPWARVVEVDARIRAHWEGTEQIHARAAKGKHGASSVIETGHYNTYRTTGWRPTCKHDALEPVPCTVLDPFAGAGTTLLVADRLQRNAIGVELNPEYAEMARRRLTNDAPMFAEVDVA